MTYIILMIVAAVFLFIYTSRTKDGSRTRPVTYKENVISTTNKNAIIPTVAELVRPVKTHEDFAQFEKKYAEIEKLYGEDFDNKQNEKLYRRYESAFRKIDDKFRD